MLPTFWNEVLKVLTLPTLYARRHVLKLDNENAIKSLTPDRFPCAKPNLLKLILQDLDAIQEDMLFQADMAQCIHHAIADGRYRSRYTSL